jgi:hypothetical protein
MDGVPFALPNPSAGPLDHYSATLDQGYMYGPYRIDLTGAGFSGSLSAADVSSPEPTSVFLLATGALALVGYHLRRRAAS